MIKVPRTAEHVSDGHPDKFCDQVADGILDRALELTGGDLAACKQVRTAIECLAKDNLLIVSGEVRWSEAVDWQLDVANLAREAWLGIGYGRDGDTLTVLNHIQRQSSDIAKGTGTGIDAGGAGDQGIMVGYATDETDCLMPREWVHARDICLRLKELRLDGTLPWLRSDTKSQVTLDADGRVTSVIVAAQHADDIANEDLRREIHQKAIVPIVGDISEKNVKINGTGRFVIGGPTGDAGVVGRKIVVDAYGPRVAVGGGAYSGKDPTKVDRSAAYMCRHIAKRVVNEKVLGAKECTVTLAYGIGQHQPEMVSAITNDGTNVAPWVGDNFPDLSPAFICDHLGLWKTEGWTFAAAASFGHYGRSQFPWEKVG